MDFGSMMGIMFFVVLIVCIGLGREYNWKIGCATGFGTLIVGSIVVQLLAFHPMGPKIVVAVVVAVLVVAILGFIIYLANKSNAKKLKKAAEIANTITGKCVSTKQKEEGKGMNKDSKTYKFYDFWAALNDGTLNDVKNIIERDIPFVNAQGDTGRTPVFLAAMANRIDVIEYLADLGADLNIRDNDDMSPIEVAVANNRINIIEYLVKRDVNLRETRNSNGQTPMFIAANGKVEAIECLARLGADVDARDKEGRTPMFIAVLVENRECIECLKRFGADIEINVDGITPIFFAAMSGKTESIKYLVNLGAKVNEPTEHGMTPIFGAAISGNITSMDCLKKLGAKLDVTNNDGKTAIDLANSFKQYEAANWLSEQVSALSGEPVTVQPSPNPLYPARTSSIDFCNDGSIFTDPRDGQKYRTVKIGNQIWMAENLNYKTGCAYDNNESNRQKYGLLYDWETAMNVSPAGWHLPTREEWDKLVQIAGGASTAGKKLKSKTGWNENGNGTDDFGFSALPGGYRFSEGDFGRVGDGGNWWSATENDGNYAYRRYMQYDRDYVGDNDNLSKDNGFSVRCVKNV